MDGDEILLSNVYNSVVRDPSVDQVTSNCAKTEHIEAIWTDLANITRFQMTTKKLYETHFKKHGFSLPYFILSLPYMNRPPYERVTGEVSFHPDDEPPRPLPWLNGVAVTFGKFYDGSTPWKCCPRSFLIDQEAKLRQFDLKIAIGFEIEFYLLNLDGSPIDSKGFGEVRSLTGKTWKFISNVVTSLKKLDIPVWKYHPEAGCGQFEISIGPFKGSILEAADMLVLSCQCIYAISASLDIKATLLPKPIDKSPGSSIHMTLSLWNTNNENYFKVCHAQADSFLAGIFKQLPGLMAVMCPNVNSYDRIQAQGFAGTFHCIGTENRKAAIRLFRDGMTVKRFEVRCPDGTSNPYLVLGSFIGAGIGGIENGHQLPIFVDVDPQTLSEEVRPPRLSASLAAAMTAFSDSAFNKELYGNELHNMILLVRNGEEAYWNSSEDTLENRMKVLLDKY